MSNAAALQIGCQKAKDLIARHVLNVILVPAAKELIQAATENRIFAGHNMTGNTVNSYAAGVYVNGQLVHIETSSGSIPRPLRRKLGQGNASMPGASGGTVICKSILSQQRPEVMEQWRQSEVSLFSNLTNHLLTAGLW